jgi:hypothetical protein
LRQKLPFLSCSFSASPILALPNEIERGEITLAGGLAVIPDGEKVAPLFAEDGVVELPFLHSIGIEPRNKGRAAIAGFYDVVRQLD